ncbi:MAG: family 10 glycosylhydrolase, partial [Rhodothermales bacterium]
MSRIVFLLLLFAPSSFAQEVRGVWLTDVDSDLLSSREHIEEGMRYLAENGFNVVYPVVWNGGYTL